MKTLFTTFFLLMGFAVSAQNSLGTSTDETAVTKVINDQTEAFFAKNREKWASYWAHEPYISWTAQGGADRILTVAGWEAYNDMFEGYFNDPKPGPTTKVLTENMQVTVLDKVATATFLQTRQSPGRNLKSREVRILEKQGNDWKLVSVYCVQSEYGVSSPLLPINICTQQSYLHTMVRLSDYNPHHFKPIRSQ